KNSSTASIDLGNFELAKKLGYDSPRRHRTKPSWSPLRLVRFATIGVPANTPNGPLNDGYPALPRRGKSTTYTEKPRRTKTVLKPSRPSGVVSQTLPVPPPPWMKM